MKVYKILFLLILFLNINLFSQSISIEVHNTLLTDTLGADIIFAIDVTNITETEQTIYLVRKVNDLPEGWTSSLCFDACFGYWVDSVTTTSEYNSSPLQPGETREVSVHVNPMENPGEGFIQLKIGGMRDTEYFIVDFTAVVYPTSVEANDYEPGIYYLHQNYPNPFNPSTNITFDLKRKGHVIIEIYNSIGQKIKTLINEEMAEGRYSINFNADGLNSGIYFYRITTPGFVNTKKMILLR